MRLGFIDAAFEEVGAVDQNHMTFRCFQPEDISELLRIQNDNLRTNLSPGDQTDGYLSVAFSAQQFMEMHSDIPIVVADRNSRLGGYLCSSTLACVGRIPLLAHMIGLFKETTFRSRPLDAYRSFVYGPVCIERGLRGIGLLNGLFDALMEQLKGRFDVGTLFISSNNPRSLRAHTHHLGMQVLSRFTFEGNEFYLLAFAVPDQHTQRCSSFQG